MAPFTAKSYEPHCRRVGGPSIKFACSVNRNYCTVEHVVLADMVCIYMVHLYVEEFFFFFRIIQLNAPGLTRDKCLRDCDYRDYNVGKLNIIEVKITNSYCILTV